ncbi:SDR family oxidoreductase [Salisaeta longa]|uniref:SDR family oxidoreductase n=1 Tax=Salisaeta longa TaxID=503170 RepID=UPI0003B3FCD8|nr:SDR family oxidoreductase [Salisaeta longa]
MDLGLTDRVAFVAGASSGLGRAAATRLAREGCTVAICSRSEARIQTAAEAIAEAAGTPPNRVLPLVCDVTDATAVAEAIAQTVDAFGALHVLVTNAGGPPSGTATEVDAADWRAALELNLMSTIHLCTAARASLEDAAAADDHARIVMVSSVSAKQPIPTLALSNTARAGVQGYAKSLAADLGPKGITVNTVLPGYTQTDRLTELAASIEARTGTSRAAVEAAWAEENALDRLGTPEEFAAAVAFLASQQAGYITGTALPVDGGRIKHLL